MHNIYYLLNLMQRARQAIIEGRYGAFVSDWMNSPAAALISSLLVCLLLLFGSMRLLLSFLGLSLAASFC